MAISTAIDASAVSRVVGIKTEFKDLRGGQVVYLPQRVALIGQGNTTVTYSLTKRDVTSSFEVGSVYGFGSPLHLAALKLLPSNGDGLGTVPLTVYPLEDAGTGVVASGDVTPSGTQTVAASYVVRAGGQSSAAFVVSPGDTVADIVTAMTAAVSANVNMPVLPTDGTTEMSFTTKWAGTSANSVVIEVIGDTTAGTAFAITQSAGGLVNPSVQPALDQIGDVWVTLAVNCLEVADTAALTEYGTFGEGRWGATTKKPMTVVTGNTLTTVSASTAVPDARASDRVNIQIPLPGSTELPLSVAARAVARIAVRANNSPARDYAGMSLDTLTPGTDGVQWDYPSRDLAVKAGSSTITVKDGVPTLNDTATFYHPSGDPIPAYRFLVTIVKLQQCIFNVDLEFNGDGWAGAPLIPDDQPTVNPYARTPKAARAAIGAILDSLGLEAIISDPATAKANTVAQISSSNPNRLDVRIPIQVSGNANIISTDLDFGFFFGSQVAL